MRSQLIKGFDFDDDFFTNNKVWLILLLESVFLVYDVQFLLGLKGNSSRGKFDFQCFLIH